MKRITILLLFATLSACSSQRLAAQTPEWVERNADKRFPPDRYWIGISSAVGNDAEEKAKESAIKQIAAQFKTLVKAKTTFTKREEIEGGASKLSETYEEKINNYIENVELTGARIVETHKQGIRVFALAALEKEAFLRPLRRELQAYQKSLSERLKTAESFASSDLSSAINAYLEVLNALEEAEPKREFFNRVSGEVFEFSNDVQPAAVEAAMRKALSEARLTMVSGNNQKGELGKAFAQPLVVKATNKSGAALRGLPIVFVAGETELGKAITNDEGVASFSPVAQADGVQGGKGKIVAALEMKNLSPRMRDEVRQNASVTFEFALDASSFLCELDLSEIEDERARRSLEQKLADALAKNGATLKRGAPLIAKAVVVAREAASVQGMSGEVVVQDVTLTLQFQRRGGSALSSVSFAAKGLGKDKESAIAKALSDIRISPSRFAEPIAKARSATE
ncbi:MAG: LPP20 family lipoprotein [Chloroherpetonaceae bacterium]|nr:LPP20 family lipoprotein [Chloroherpetonaceae bacterium]